MAIKYHSETWAICKLISAQKHTDNIEAVRLLNKAITAIRLGRKGPQAYEGWIPTQPQFDRINHGPFAHPVSK